MARAIVILALLAVGLAGASARFAPAEGSFGRALLQDCSRIDNCAACENRRVAGTTTLLCTTCSANYAVSDDRLACECAPGYTRTSASAACAPCGTGSWCAGGLTAGNTTCGAGFTTQIDVATRQEQCVSLPGYGVSSDGSTASACPIGSFSAGGTRNPCRPCGAGLTTAAVQSTSAEDCKAPDGYFFDKSAAKPCPKGTYKTGLDRATTCTRCADGVTTADSKSTASSDCNKAKRGYFISSVNNATKCALNSYQSVQGAAIGVTCDACPTDMITKATGSSTSAACVAPKGYGYVNGIAEVCAIGSFKAGANRRQCVSCGTGFITTGTGKTSFADCYIRQGFGSAKDGGAWTAAQCPIGTYGASSDTYGVKNLPCTPCPAGMNTTAAGSSRPEDCLNMPGYGYDQATQTAQICALGSFNAGNNRDECAACGEGKTTMQTGSTDVAQCVIAPGYGATANGPEPCPKGTFGLGGTSGATCTACSGQTTTAKDSLAVAQSECTLCNAGYGGVGCGDCAAGSYNAGDSSVCTTCPSGTTSPLTSTSSEDCVATWTPLAPSLDTIAWTAGASFMASAAKADAAACKASCDGSCMFYAYNVTSGDCYKASEISGSDAKIMFKNAATKYTTWGWNSAVADIGETIGSVLSLNTGAACAAKCDESDACVALVYKSGACRLIAAKADSDIKGFAMQGIGAKMNVAMA